LQAPQCFAVGSTCVLQTAHINSYLSPLNLSYLASQIRYALIVGSDGSEIVAKNQSHTTIIDIIPKSVERIPTATLEKLRLVISIM
jgi:hypothetical protein